MSSEITNIIGKMKSSGSPNSPDRILIIAFKRSPYIRSYLTKLTEVIWRTNTISPQWRRAITILIHKKDDPSNFRPLTLQSIPLKVFTSALRNKLFAFSRKFTPGMSGSFERTANIVHLIRQAKRNQRSHVVTLQGLKNAFGEVHYNLIPVVLAHRHIPDNIIQAIMSIYEDFTSAVAIDSFTTPFLHIKKSALQGNCLSP